MSDVITKSPASSSVASAEDSSSGFKPFIPAGVNIPEFTIGPLIVGVVLGMIFGASSLYLVLKVGLTVSASIPVAVISITLFRILSKFGVRDATILENNIVQTAGSAGESIAFGVGVTMPAIMILGFDLEVTRVLLVAVLGGILGILMMIPLRRALIVKQHGILKYPEGTACAEVLKAGASAESRAVASESAKAEMAQADERSPESAGGTGAKTIFAGFGIGLLYQTAMEALKAWKDVPVKIFGAPFAGASLSAEISPALLGVGYVIGPRIASIMCAGGVLAYLVLIPAIKLFGGVSPLIIPPGTKPISQMGPDEVRGAYVLYIGAGAVAAGGIISLLRSLPIIWRGLKEGLRDFGGGRADTAGVPRTERDLPMTVVFGGIAALVIAIVAFRNLQMNFVGALLIVAFGFLFVTVSSRLTGEIGSSSNPISGMTVATLLLTCLIFLARGWTGPMYYVTALSVGAIVCIASSNGGSTSQDLKTGYLIGATPKLQQIAIMLGALASALVLGPILLTLNNNSTVYVPRVTFQQIKDSKLPAESVDALPLYSDAVKPAGSAVYHLLDNAQTPPVPPPSGLAPGQYLVDGSGAIAYKIQQSFPASLRADMSALQPNKEGLKGPQSETDQNTYSIWHKLDDAGGPAGRYLVSAQGVPVYLEDPGINGTHKTRPDGTTVNKYDAPKAVLMSYIIKGILNHQLPWGLVLLGVMIAIVLEMSGIPSLAFAVGVYLPLSSSSPIFIGGMVRWLVDKRLRKRLEHLKLTEDQLNAEADKSPGVLMASGYIAGAALAAIIIAFMAGVLTNVDEKLKVWATAHNPFFIGPNSDFLSLIPFGVLVLLLYLVGRETILSNKPAKTNETRT